MCVCKGGWVGFVLFFPKDNMLWQYFRNSPSIKQKEKQAIQQKYQSSRPLFPLEFAETSLGWVVMVPWAYVLHLNKGTVSKFGAMGSYIMLFPTGAACCIVSNPLLTYTYNGRGQPPFKCLYVHGVQHRDPCTHTR